MLFITLGKLWISHLLFQSLIASLSPFIRCKHPLHSSSFYYISFHSFEMRCTKCRQSYTNLYFFWLFWFGFSHSIYSIFVHNILSTRFLRTSIIQIHYILLTFHTLFISIAFVFSPYHPLSFLEQTCVWLTSSDTSLSQCSVTKPFWPWKKNVT